MKRQGLLVDTPENVVKLIRDMRADTPLTELCFWSHPPGVPHDAIMAHLERVAKHVLPTFTSA